MQIFLCGKFPKPLTIQYLPMVLGQSERAKKLAIIMIVA